MMTLSDGDRSRLASGFNAVIPAQAGIQGFLDLQAKINMAPRLRWGDELMK
ncbi:MAG: hypothetical protein Q8L45_11120 [Xanthomonadaceae bacterium]|nr:hypothetical protein [Xanthomonadaceae bacterium]MDP2185871.1 hypothetical protein [Xanthomonadales bacterium]MDZ4117216.1 hypothetical protein [Xanthomonadaceae bacterium]